jgi:hypothetical protein
MFHFAVIHQIIERKILMEISQSFQGSICPSQKPVFLPADA